MSGLTERERLVELINQKGDAFDERFGIECGRLADYLLENGVVVLPCKVGDTVYIITTASKKIIITKVIGIWKYENGDAVLTESGGIHQNLWGKTVFLTREEAEAALKEQNVNNK